MSLFSLVSRNYMKNVRTFVLKSPDYNNHMIIKVIFRETSLLWLD